MILKDWYNFNYGLIMTEDWVIKVMSYSYNNADTIFETVMKSYHAMQLFGEYQLKQIKCTALESGHCTLRLLLWPPETK